MLLDDTDWQSDTLYKMFGERGDRKRALAVLIHLAILIHGSIVGL